MPENHVDLDSLCANRFFPGSRFLLLLVAKFQEMHDNHSGPALDFVRLAFPQVLNLLHDVLDIDFVEAAAAQQLRHCHAPLVEIGIVEAGAHPPARSGIQRPWYDDKP